MKRNDSHQIAWHYSKAIHWPNIERDGVLRPTTVGIDIHERPILWFSSNQLWERTASIGIFNPTTQKMATATMEQTCESVGGLIRFGRPVDSLVQWPELGVNARMTKEARAQLASSALKIGANPQCWHGFYDPIPISATIIEVWNPEKQEWVRSYSPGEE